MMKNEEQRKRIERVVLSQVTVGRIDQWLADLEIYCRGIKLKRKDLVEWLVQTHSAGLSKTEMKAVKDRFFDEVAQAKWLLDTLKTAKDRGEQTKMADLLGTCRSSNKAKANRNPESPA